MAEREIVHHVTLALEHDYRFVASFDDVPGGNPILLDEPPPLGEGRVPNAAALLAAAVGNCLAASLTFCLRKTRADLQGLTVVVTTRVRKNENGRFRVSHIEVDLSPDLGSDDAGRLRRCEDLFEDFCIVTDSVRKGIPIEVTVTPRHVELASARP